MDFTPVTTNALALLNDSSRNVARQVTSASVAVLASNPTAEDLPVITWRNRRFVWKPRLPGRGPVAGQAGLRTLGSF
ncbi:hypothetical protein B0J13DRAFT_576228 [Dactylonectria estremocensis]|uniref:Uncharacterized protein n=1 Tax=Dactylonectria estremocensis TaxID=1079267 RepID=A0A9P9I9Y3_9HYPO|nr:hypothetical protein B0J13DRAFT_576228 [Dactylonectria estremocensis]